MSISNQRTLAQIDAGLRAYMVKIYNYMTLGLVITGLTAYLVSSSPALMQTIFTTPLGFIVMFGPLALMFFLSFKIGSLKVQTAQMLFWAIAGLMGISLSSIFFVYTQTSIVRVFFITSATFATMSLYGYTTKTDLSRFGAILFMGVIGIVIASVVNIFTKSSALDLIISIVGVIVFTALVAYDTQQIKSLYLEEDNPEIADKKAVMGALSLYINFINIFIMLLRLIGERR